MKVLILCGHLQRTIELYRSLFANKGINIDVPLLAGRQQFSEADLLPIIAAYDGVIAGDDHFTARVLQAGRSGKLKVVAKWGIGLDAIDLKAAAALGISVFNTPDVFADEVADVALTYVLLLARQIHVMHNSVLTNGWLKIPGMSLRGKTAGVIGVGSIGKAIVERLHILGMHVIGVDPCPVDVSFITKNNMLQLSFEEMISKVDFIVVSCALTADNYHLLNENAFSSMKQGVRIVNVARGALIDENALVQAMLTGKVLGAALDVFEIEPLPASSPLRQFDSIIFGTHNGSNTQDAVLRVNMLAIRNVLTGLGIDLS